MNKLSKIVLPKEVAQIIERYRSEGFSNATILQRYFDGGVDAVDLVILDVDADVLIGALVNGYEAELSPEENVREYYEKCKENWLIADDEGNLQSAEFLNGQILGIRFTLNLLGIKIEGVNA